MKRLVRAFSTSIGKKYLMAGTGLLLCGFLITHLAGNLLLYVGPKAYNDYAHKLHSFGPLLTAAELGLAGLFVLHIVLAFQTSRENSAARTTRYHMQESKIKDRIGLVRPETWMLISGLVILAFLILHLTDFRFELRESIVPVSGLHYDKLEPYGKAKILLTNPLTVAVYALGSAILGFHLAHGVGSSFQSLGWNHPKYEPLIRWISILFAAAMAFGFLSFPIVFGMFGT